VITSCVTCKCNAVGTLGITPNDGKKRYMRCLGRHTSNPFYGGILDLDTNSKQPVKKETLETIAESWQGTQMTH